MNRFKNSETVIPFRPRLGIYKATNNSFNPNTGEAFSYNWWRYVILINGRYVFNTHKYSVTTGGHQSAMRSLMNQLGLPIYLEVNFRESLSVERVQREALPAMFEEALTLEMQAKRKGVRQSTKEHIKSQLQQIKINAKRARELGCTITAAQKASIRQNVTEEETDRLEALAKKREAEKSQRDQARRVIKNDVTFNPQSLLA